MLGGGLPGDAQAVAGDHRDRTRTAARLVTSRQNSGQVVGGGREVTPLCMPGTLLPGTMTVDHLTTGSPPQIDAQLRGYGWRRRGDREVKISSAVSPLAWTMGIRAASARAGA